jgi:hypothetical protein
MAKNDHLVAYEGWVACPQRGADEDFERCITCRWFEGLVQGRALEVVCSFRRAPGNRPSDLLFG